MLRELAIICITPPLESKPLLMTRLRAIDLGNVAVLGTLLILSVLFTTCY